MQYAEIASITKYLEICERVIFGVTMKEVTEKLWYLPTLM